MAAQEPQDPVDLDVVEVGGGLVGQHERRVLDEGPGDGHPLLLSSRHLIGTMVTPLVQTDLLQQDIGTVPRLARPHAGQPEGDHHVRTGVEARDQVEGLEHDADGVAPIVGEGGTAETRYHRLPSRVIDPAVGVSNPARHDRSVVFPQPDGPSRTTSSPSSAEKENSWRGRTL